jgi:hypothetical protein
VLTAAGGFSSTHLVLNLALDVGDVDGLCEGGAVLVEFDRLGPVVESAGYVDFFSRMLPNGKEKKQRSAQLERFAEQQVVV